jgi:hypothetical protein
MNRGGATMVNSWGLASRGDVASISGLGSACCLSARALQSIDSDTPAVLARCGRVGARAGGLRYDFALTGALIAGSAGPGSGFAALMLSHSTGLTASDGGSEAAARLGERARRISRGDEPGVLSRVRGHSGLFLVSEVLGVSSFKLCLP